MSKRLLMRVGVLAVATVFALSGCVFILTGFDPEDYTADVQIEGNWNEDSAEIDLWISYPSPEDLATADNPTTNDDGVPAFSDPYYNAIEQGATEGDPGFYLEDAITFPGFRKKVHPSAKESTYTSSGNAAIQLVDEYSSEGEEGILINRPPWSYNGDTLNFRNAPDADIGLPTGPEGYAWVGVSEVYADAGSGNIAAADLEVTIYDADRNPLLSLRPPEDTRYSSASIARIHYFIADRGTSYDPYYLIVPDQRWITNGTDGFRSVTGTTTDGETFVGAFGRAETE